MEPKKRSKTDHLFKPGVVVKSPGRKGAGGIKNRRTLKRKAQLEADAIAQAKLFAYEYKELQRRVKALEKLTSTQATLLRLLLEGKTNVQKKIVRPVQKRRSVRA